MLKELLTPTWARNLAGPRVAKAAEKLAKTGAVRNMVSPDEDRVDAEVVAGSETHRVGIVAEGERIRWQCACKAGKAGGFCEHAAALALLFTGAAVPVTKKKATPASPIAQLRQFLAEMPPEELRDILLVIAERDRNVKEQLLTRMRVARLRTSFNEQAAAEALLAAIRAGGEKKVGVNETRPYIKPIQALVEGLEDALEAGHGSAVQRICEQTLVEFGLHLLARVADHGGRTGGACLDELVELHFAACESSPPPPRELADSLFRLANEFPRDDFLSSPRIYAKLLGKEGLARIGELLKGHAPDGPADIARFKEAYLLVSGDIDGLIELISSDIRGPGDYTTLATLCERAGRHAEAALWLLLALAATAPSEKALQEKVIEHLEPEQISLVLKGMRDMFARRPSIEYFRLLRIIATLAEQWEPTLAAAIDAIRAKLELEKAAAAADPEKRVDYSTLVVALLDANDVEGAWQAARSGICREYLRLELARRRAATFPNEAFEEFRSGVIRALEMKEAFTDEDAAERVLELRQLAQAASREQAFRVFIAKLRTEYKGRKKFLRLVAHL